MLQDGDRMVVGSENIVEYVDERCPQGKLWAEPEGAQGVRPPGKSQDAICSLRNTCTDLPRDAIGPNCFSREVRTASASYPRCL